MYLRKSPCIVLACIALSVILSNCRKELKEINAAAVETNSLERVTTRPNVLIIIGDDIGYEVPTCNGGQSYSTPNLDYLAANGKRFINCYASPLCCPSRFALLTGKYNFRNYTQWGKLNTDQKTIANMLSDAGYATCYSGKWQLDGGDYSIHTFGWQKYSVWLPFYQEFEGQEGSRYKSSRIYQEGAYMPAEFSQDKFSDDIFTDYLLRFTDSVQASGTPFLAYYSMILGHEPWVPTPDDSAYTTWEYTGGYSDSTYFPSMVKYMDKKIGQIYHHLDSTGQLGNTIIFFVSDNGNSKSVLSQFNGVTVQGGKGSSTEAGTNVPLIVYYKDKAIPSVSTALIDFTDFLPTIAELTSTVKPTTWGVLDGKSFKKLITTATDLQIRKNVYNAYMEGLHRISPFERWAQNGQYKLYDTLFGGSTSGLFVKVHKCLPDTVLNLASLTPDQITVRKTLLSQLVKYRADTNKITVACREHGD